MSCQSACRTCHARNRALITGILVITFAACGCRVDDNGDGSALPLAGILDGLGTIAPTTSDNNDPNTNGSNTNGDEPTVSDSDPETPVDSLDDSVQVKVVELVNVRRQQGADCGSEGVFAPTDPLNSNDTLATMAQDHSTDMSMRAFFDHTNPDGIGPGERMAASTYQWSTWGENIAAGQRTADEVVESWMNSDGHCSNIMNPAFKEIGVGYAAKGSYWTQMFAAPR
ncbi:MAG: CAP domain-containing protein [Planctomycetes bacterium]|nr:CAP domain-containing protein [Planctomycetota bacterium]